MWLSVALSSPYASRVPTFNTSPSQLSGGIHPNARTLNIAPEFWIFIKFERNCFCRTSIYTYGRYARNLVFFWIGVFLPFPSSILPMTADGKHGLHCLPIFSPLTTAQILGTKPSPLHSFLDRSQSAHDQVDLSVTSLDLFSLTALCYNNFQTRRFDQARSRCPLP